MKTHKFPKVMNFRDLAEKRRSTRKFADRPVEKEVIDKVIETTLTAPSSKNLRTSRVAYTTNPAHMNSISEMRSMGSAFVKEAPLAFFILGDDTATDLWRENAAISATVMQFALEDLGLGSCWVQVFGRPHREDHPQEKTAEDFLRENIPGLPVGRIMCVIAAGYPETEPKIRTRKDDSDKIFPL